jgi:hypothetical protein
MDQSSVGHFEIIVHPSPDIENRREGLPAAARIMPFGNNISQPVAYKWHFVTVETGSDDFSTLPRFRRAAVSKYFKDNVTQFILFMYNPISDICKENFQSISHKFFSHPEQLSLYMENGVDILISAYNYILGRA